MPEDQRKSHSELAGEWVAFNSVAVLGQYGLNRLIDHYPQASHVFNYTDSHWIGLSNLMGISVVDTAHAFYIMCAEANEGAKFAKLIGRIPGNIIAAEVAEAIYLGINRYYFQRDITKVNDWEKAAVRTVGTSVVRVVTSGIYQGLQACGLFGNRRSVYDNDLDAQLLDNQERGIVAPNRYGFGSRSNY